MINWILQKNLTKPETLARIKNALTKADETWEEIEVIPFSNQLPYLKNQHAFPIPYGSTTFMLNAFQDKNYQQGVFYHPEHFQMKNYAAQWGNHILNHDGQCMEFGKIATIKSTAFQKWFVRPNHDGKEFSGRVDTFEALKNWSQKICALDLLDFNAATEIWIAKPQKIDKEWRLFIVDNKIISVSKYMENGELKESATDIPTEMLQFTRERIKEYQLSDVYVMDIAKVQQQFKIIECNCFNGTGFYHHDIEKIVRAINHFIREKLD